MQTGQKKYSLVWLLSLVSFVSIILISYLKTSLELEDAEQAYYSQWWRLGYDDQPPLYTWMQKAVNAVFGVSKFSFSFLRGFLFAATLLMLYNFGKKVLNDRTKAELLVFGTVLIPVFIDFTFRRLSHTLLLCLIVLLTFLALAKLVEKKTAGRYLFLGICFGIGMLSKYNYALFLIALMAASFFNSLIKKVLWNKQILISYGVAFILFSPHLYWLIEGNFSSFVQDSLHTKLETSGEGIFFLTSFLETVKAFLEISYPLLLIFFLLGLLKKVRWEPILGLKWLVGLMVAQLSVFIILFVSMNVQEVQTRWLLPLLLPYLVLFLAKLNVKDKRVYNISAIVFFLVVTFQVLRTPAERLVGITSDVHFDYTELSEKLRKEYQDKNWILPNVTYGGQIKLLNPNKEIFTLDDFSVPQVKKDQKYVVFTTDDNFVGNHPEENTLSQHGPDKEDLYFYVVTGSINSIISEVRESQK